MGSNGEYSEQCSLKNFKNLVIILTIAALPLSLILIIKLISNILKI